MDTKCIEAISKLSHILKYQEPTNSKANDKLKTSEGAQITKTLLNIDTFS